MSPVHNYKRIENDVVGTVGKKIRAIAKALFSFFQRVHQTGKQRFTVMFIPHSEKKIFNFQISIYSLSFFLVLVVMIVVVIFFLSTQMTYSDVQMSRKDSKIVSSEMFLNDFREIMLDFNKEKDNFKILVGNLWALANPGLENAFVSTAIGGNTPSYSEGAAIPDSLKELNDLKTLFTILKNSEAPLRSIITNVEQQNKLFDGIPRLWPLEGAGFITFNFGPQIHPIFGYWYIHTGLDLVYAYGANVSATASGKVLRVHYDSGYGNYVLIGHKYGFSTLYAHLDSVFVQKGQEIKAGEIVGTLGASGTVTGAHLHYEVRLGNQEVDPQSFIIKPEAETARYSK